jgi:hypothetical protein
VDTVRCGTGETRPGCRGGRARAGGSPTRQPGPTSGEGGPYKPSVKGDRAGRESEGPILCAGQCSGQEG